MMGEMKSLTRHNTIPRIGCGAQLVLPGVGAFLVLDDVVYDTDAIAIDEISGEGRDGENNAGGYFWFDRSVDTQPSAVFLPVSKRVQDV